MPGTFLFSQTQRHSHQQQILFTLSGTSINNCVSSTTVGVAIQLPVVAISLSVQETVCVLSRFHLPASRGQQFIPGTTQPRPKFNGIPYLSASDHLAA